MELVKLLANRPKEVFGEAVAGMPSCAAAA